MYLLYISYIKIATEKQKKWGTRPHNREPVPHKKIGEPIKAA
nr:MAG TPA: hypothetical protein [Caudoviricetes sp.]